MSKGKQRLSCHRGYRVPSSVTTWVRGVFTLTSLLVNHRALYSTGHDFITNNVTLLFN